eukprot:31529-Pelagococcus_subviridis.AAC.17
MMRTTTSTIDSRFDLRFAMIDRRDECQRRLSVSCDTRNPRRASSPIAPKESTRSRCPKPTRTNVVWCVVSM